MRCNGFRPVSRAIRSHLLMAHIHSKLLMTIQYMTMNSAQTTHFCHLPFSAVKPRRHALAEGKLLTMLGNQ